MPAVLHRSEVPARGATAGDINFTRQRLGARAGCARIGLSHYAVAPGARQMPLHVHGDEEEIFFVLSGSGISVQGREGESGCAVAAGDTVVHVAGRLPHTFLAGEDGLELLAFASGSETSITHLPRARTMWCGPHWVPVDGPHPFEAEAAAGPLRRPEPGERPGNVAALEAVGPQAREDGEIRRLGSAAGSRLAGLNHVTAAPGVRVTAPHVHALEEELFYVLAGSGELALGDATHALRTGDVVARPPGTGVPHALTAGDDGLTYLVYGTRVPGDSVFFPERRQVRLRGLGVTLDV